MSGIPDDFLVFVFVFETENRIYFVFVVTVKTRGRARPQNGSGHNITKGTAEGGGGNTSSRAGVGGENTPPVKSFRTPPFFQFLLKFKHFNVSMYSEIKAENK